MMHENEIKANYLHIYMDIFKLLENFEKVQKPTNDVVGKFLGTTLVADTTLAEIKSAIDEQKLTSEIVNKFFEGSSPKDITTKISNIDWYIKNQGRLGIENLLVSFFLARGMGG